MRKLAAIFTTILLINHVHAQDRFNVTIGTGVGQYEMKDLKELQGLYANYSGTTLKLIDNFPMYPYYTADVSVRFAKIFRAGASYRFQSTGAKSAYSDYSGVTSFEQIVSAKNWGIILGIDVHQWGKFALSSQVKTYYAWTQLDIEENYELYDGPSNHPTVIFKFRSFMVNPEVTLSYSIIDHLSAGLSSGYCIDLKDNKRYLISPGNGETMTPDWSGLRIGISASYSF